jgi:hypothetical protein
MNALTSILHEGQRELESNELEFVKGFSATKAMVRYECVLSSKTNR